MKLFVILPRVPYPVEKGDKLRAFNQIKYLSKHFELHLCALNDDQVHPQAYQEIQPYCKSFHILKISRVSVVINLIRAFFSGLPFQIGYYFNSKIERKIHKLIDEVKPDHIYCQLVRTAEYVKDVAIPKSIDYQDVFSKGIERRYQKAPFYLKPIFNLEYKRLVKYEALVYDRFQHKTIISESDRDLIQHPKHDQIHIVRNGVDFKFFHPIEKNKKYDLVFTGNMNYAPNVNAALFLVNKVMPLVWQQNSNITLLLAGASPNPKVKALASDKVHISGWMDDIRDAYAESKVFIAPMQIGTGLQNKLLEAMSMNMPCITSDLANAALKAAKDREVLIGAEPEQYAGHIIKLLEDEGYATEIADAGHQYVLKNFDWDGATKILAELIQNTNH
ncbi:MAG: glycosyltransferase [Bacteroidales bacterium]|nr:glycosyltransferase [Bacteroidales bacterium]